MKKSALIGAITALFIFASNPSYGADEIPEASGIARHENKLYLVGDDSPGAYFEAPNPTPAIGAPITIVTTKVPVGKADLGIDLEAIEVLEDGRVLLLSEQLNALLVVKDNSGTMSVTTVVEYHDQFAEVGGRGMEGLAARKTEGNFSRIAVLWEGGYPTTEDLPRELVNAPAMCPVVFTHNLESEAPSEIRYLRLPPYNKYITLKIPDYEKMAQTKNLTYQRFRSPDLVWYLYQNPNGKKEWGFIALLGSRSLDENLEPRKMRYQYTLLQRFTKDGFPFGEPIDIKSIVPDNLKTKNWEGMDWYDDQKKLILVYDDNSQPTPYILDIMSEERWPKIIAVSEPKILACHPPLRYLQLKR